MKQRGSRGDTCNLTEDDFIEINFLMITFPKTQTQIIIIITLLLGCPVLPLFVRHKPGCWHGEEAAARQAQEEYQEPHRTGVVRHDDLKR